LHTSRSLLNEGHEVAVAVAVAVVAAAAAAADSTAVAEHVERAVEVYSDDVAVEVFGGEFDAAADNLAVGATCFAAAADEEALGADPKESADADPTAVVAVAHEGQAFAVAVADQPTVAVAVVDQPTAAAFV
jgi:hypothetical protein